MEICSANEVSKMTSFWVIFLLLFDVFALLQCSYNPALFLWRIFLLPLAAKAFVSAVCRTSAKGFIRKSLFPAILRALGATLMINSQRENFCTRTQALTLGRIINRRSNIIHKLTARRELAKCASRTKTTLAINCVEKGIIPSAEERRLRTRDKPRDCKYVFDLLRVRALLFMARRQ